MATNKRTLSRIGFYCGLALFLIITLFPFFVMLMTSFKSAKEAISLHPTLLPQQWTLEHYVDLKLWQKWAVKVSSFRLRGACLPSAYRR